MLAIVVFSILRLLPPVAGGVLFPGAFGDSNISAFDKSGKLYFAPSTLNTIPNDDSTVIDFQGRVQFDYLVTIGGVTSADSLIVVVGAGISFSGEASVASSAARLDIARIQQRLNLLGFTDSAGERLSVNGLFDAKTEDVAKRFKAAVDSTGEASPTAISKDLLFDPRSLRWLNAPNAPQWSQLQSLNSPNSLATNWVVNTLSSASGSFNGQTVLQRVRDLSKPTSASTPLYNTTWGSHLSGMDADVGTAGLSDTQTFAMMQSIIAGSTNLLNAIPTAFRLPDNATGVSARNLFNAWTGRGTISATVETAITTSILHVDFQPPVLSEFAAGESKIFSSGLTQLSVGFKPQGSMDLLSKPLPVVGFIGKLPDGGNPDAQISIGSATKTDMRISDLFKAIATYLDSNPGATLNTLVSSLPFQISGLTLGKLTESSGEFRLPLTYEPTLAAIPRDLNLGTNAQKR